MVSRAERQINNLYTTTGKNQLQNELLYEFLSDYRESSKTMGHFMLEKNRSFSFRLRLFIQKVIKRNRPDMTLVNEFSLYTSRELYIIFKFIENHENSILRNKSLSLKEIANAALKVNEINDSHARTLDDVLNPFTEYIANQIQSPNRVYFNRINDNDCIFSLFIKMLNLFGEKNSLFFLKYIFCGTIENGVYMGERFWTSNIIMRLLAHDESTWEKFSSLYSDNIPMQWFVSLYIDFFISNIAELDGRRKVDNEGGEKEFCDDYIDFLNDEIRSKGLIFNG